MTNININNAVSQVSGVPAKNLATLTSIENLCISDAIFTAKTTGTDDTIGLNVGIGVLTIDLNTMQCKFVPSQELKNNIKAAMSGKNVLIEKLEDSIIEKLIKKVEAL